MAHLTSSGAALLVEAARLSIWLVILLAIFVPLERLAGARKARLFRGQFGVDLAYYFLNNLLLNLVLVVPLAAFATVLRHAIPPQVAAATALLPLWAKVLATFVVGEVGFYWGHRWSHEIPLLWRFHAVHHSATHMDWLVNSRAHPIDIVFTRLIGLLPVYALGLSSAGVDRSALPAVLLLVTGTLWGFFIHANTRLRFGPLEWLVATPAFHHWHHTNDHNRDHNYASTLPWLDRLFGTHHLPRRQLPPSYGIDGPMAPTLAGQLFNPLRETTEGTPAGRAA